VRELTRIGETYFHLENGESKY